MKPGDIVGYRGVGWLSDEIDRLTGNAGWSHVGILICTQDPPGPIVIEALTHVDTDLLVNSIADDEHAWIVNDKTLTDDQRRKIVAKALTFTAAPYNYGAIALQLLDAETRTRWFTEHFASTAFPICSMLDALAEEAGGVILPPCDPDTSITPNDFRRWVDSDPVRFIVSQIK